MKRGINSLYQTIEAKVFPGKKKKKKKGNRFVRLRGCFFSFPEDWGFWGEIMG